MTLETAKDAVLYLCKMADKAKNMPSKGITINFFGGEPMLRFEEIIKPLVEWAEKLNINYSTLLYRFRRGWSVEKAFNTEVKNAK
jgi:sulfatase maturation enzyme AslB (radical SAM superfamily)